MGDCPSLCCSMGQWGWLPLLGAQPPCWAEGAETGGAGKELRSVGSQRGKHVQGLPLLSFKLIAAFSADLHESRTEVTVTLLNTVLMSLAQLGHIILHHLLHAGPRRPQQLFLGGRGWQCIKNWWDWDVVHMSR